MKFLKTLSFLLACLMLCPFIASCGSNVVKVNVHLSVFTKDENGNEELICGPFDGEIKGTEENPPTVLQATKEILESNSIQYTADDKFITSINSQKEGQKNGKSYAWIFTLNDKEPEDTGARNTTLSEGDVIVFYLSPLEVEK